MTDSSEISFPALRISARRMSIPPALEIDDADVYRSHLPSVPPSGEASANVAYAR